MAPPGRRAELLKPNAVGGVGLANARAMGRGEQGRRVSASRTTVPGDGAHVWRPRRAGYPRPHGGGLLRLAERNVPKQTLPAFQQQQQIQPKDDGKE